MIHEQRIDSNVRRRGDGFRHEAYLGTNVYTGESHRQHDKSPEACRQVSRSSGQTRRIWWSMGSQVDRCLHSFLNDIRAVCHGILRHTGNSRKIKKRHSEFSGFRPQWLEASRGIRFASGGSAGNAGNIGVLFWQLTS